jgi:prepilin-type N-terminal cleavage/methylation domain-containing protein
MSKMKSARKAFTLVEIMIVVLIIGILLAIAVPNFVARAASRQKACVANLRQIESAKQQWAMDNRKAPTDSPTWPGDLVSAGGTATEKYIKGATPVCPTTAGAYNPNTVNTDAVCPNPTAPDGITGIDHILNIP